MQKRSKFAKFLITLTVLSVVNMAVLSLLFSWIWKEQAEIKTRENCTTITHAAVKQFDGDRIIDEANANTASTLTENRILLLVWAYLNNESDPGYIMSEFDKISKFMEAVAIDLPDEYVSIYGDMPKEEYDEVMAAILNRGDIMHYITPTQIEVGGVTYCSIPASDGKKIAIGRILQDSGNDSEFTTALYGTYGVPKNGALVVTDPNGEILRVEGEFSAAVGDTLDAAINSNGRMTVNGVAYIADAAESDVCRFIAAVPVSAISSGNIASPYMLAGCFTLFFLMISLYAWFLRTDYIQGRVELDRNRNEHSESMVNAFIKRIRLFFVTAGVLVSLLITLLLSLEIVDSVRIRNIQLLNDVQQSLSYADVTEKYIDGLNNESSLEIMNQFAGLIREYPELKEQEKLDEISSFVFKDIYIVNRDGTVAASSSKKYDLSDLFNEEKDLYALNAVLKGQANYMTAQVQSDTYSKEIVSAEAVQRLDEEGMILFIPYYTGEENKQTLFSDFKMPDGHILLAITDDDHMITTSSNPEYTGKNITDLGLSESILVNGFVGDLNIDGKRSFAVITKSINIFSCIAVGFGYLVTVYAKLILLTLIGGVGLAAVLLLLERRILSDEIQDILLADPLWREEMKHEQPSEKAKKEKNELTDSYYREEDGELIAQTTAVGRWLHFTTPFRRQTADEKLMLLIQLFATAAIIIIYILNKDVSGIAGNTIAYLLSEKWIRGFNVYGLTYALIVAIFIMMAAVILRRFTILIGKNFGSRGETIARLIDSFITYVSAIAAVAVGLTYVGVNTTAVLTSVGIVGIGLTLGAKDLITDILAGISIVFEGEFRKGDIVEIKGFRGTVEEIGIRTTKVMGAGNVKIFRNSEISGVLNLTQRHSFAVVKVHISREEPLAHTEALFRKRLADIQKKYPQAVDTMKLNAVTDMTPYFYLFEISAKCREEDRFQLQLNLRKEMILLMEEEHIKSWGRPDKTDLPGIE